MAHLNRNLYMHFLCILQQTLQLLFRRVLQLRHSHLVPMAKSGQLLIRSLILVSQMEAIIHITVTSAEEETNNRRQTLASAFSARSSLSN